MQNEKNNKSRHLVFIADNEGMNTFFPKLVGLLKSEQVSHAHISLLYFSENKPFIFYDEITVLTTRFPVSFISYFKENPQRELLETILNTNTKESIEFHLFVQEEWQEILVDHLLFLGVKATTIFSNKVTNYQQ